MIFRPASHLLLSFFLFIAVFCKLEPKGIKDLKNAPLVTFTHDFPKTSKSNIKIDNESFVRINMTNASPLKKTVYGLEGFFTDPTDATKVIHEISKDRVQIVVKPGKTIKLKYRFTPRMEPAEVGLMVLVKYYDSDETGYNSVGALEKIEVVYGDSPYDLQSISIYILFGAIIAYVVPYLFGRTSSSTAKNDTKSKVKKVKNPKPAPKSVQPSTEPDMEWIPDHVVKTAARASTTSRKQK